MRKTEFTVKYKISDIEPTSIELHRISLTTFSDTIKSFIDGNFDGVADVKIKMTRGLECYVSLATQYVAHFCKLLLSYTYGKVYLSITIECNQNELVVRVEGDRNLGLDRRDMAELIRAARNARFAVTMGERGLILTRDVHMHYIYSIYAISTNVLEATLNEIFFSGYVEPDNEEQKSNK